MRSALADNEQTGFGGAPRYTVISKAGERGTEYDDPLAAADAFAQAKAEDKPFVLRHRGELTAVIASVHAGRKQLVAGAVGVEPFRAAFEALAQEATLPA